MMDLTVLLAILTFQVVIDPNPPLSPIGGGGGTTPTSPIGGGGGVLPPGGIGSGGGTIVGGL